MALNDFFVWGDGGAQLTPEQIARRKEIESAILAKQGIDVSPVASWTQGAARVADAIAGAFRRGSLDRAEKANTAYNSDLLSGLLNNGGGGSGSIPMTSAASEVSASSPAPTGQEWETVGPRLVSDLSKDFQLSPEQAAGVVGQLGHESGGFGTLQEKSPMIPGSRGGYGYAQWTGPRRKAFEEWSQANGLDPSSYEANYGFLKNELANSPEGKVLDGLRAAPDAQTAGRVFTDQFLRPGIPNYGSRSQWTDKALAFAPQQVASISPQTATDAIAAASPRPAPALPAPTTVAAPPPVAAVPSVAPTPVGGVQVAQDMSGPVLANAMKVLSDPRANANTKAIAEILVRQGQARQQAILEQQLKQSDPGYQADLRLKNLQADQLANPRISPTDQANIDLNKEKFGFEKDQAGLTPGIKEYNAYAADEIKAGRQPVSRLDYEIAIRKSSANNTTINNGEGNKFYNTLDENNAKIFSNLSDAGIQGRSKLGQIDQLDSLLQSTGSGWATALKAKAGDIGINTEGLSDIQAATAMLSKMIPEQRAPGSGPVSDADLEGFRNSLPRLINQPGGNATIINTMRGLTQYQISMGEIADRVADRSITPEEGRRQIRELPNPLANFRPPEPGQESNGWSPVQTDIPGVKIRRKN